MITILALIPFAVALVAGEFAFRRIAKPLDKRKF